MKLLRSISAKVIIIVLFSILITFLLTGSIYYHYESKRLMRKLHNDSEITLKRILYTTKVPLWNFDVKTIQDILNIELMNKSVLAIFIHGDKGSYIYGLCKGENNKVIPFKEKSQVANLLKQRTFVIDGDINHNSLTLGHCELYIVDTDIREQQNFLFVFTFSTCLILSFISCLILIFSLKRVVLNKISALHKGVRSFTAQEYDTQVSITTDDELGDLALSFNDMITKIKSYNEHLEDLVKKRTAELKRTQQALLDTAYKSGMTELATNILHNLGNIMNSITTSCGLLSEQLENSKIKKIFKANSYLKENINNLEELFIHSDKGKDIILYYLDLEEKIKTEYQTALTNIDRLEQKIQSINNIIKSNEKFISSDTYLTIINPTSLLTEVIDLLENDLKAAQIDVKQSLKPVPDILTQRNRFIYILLNICHFAMAKLESEPSPKQLNINLSADNKFTYIVIRISGEGIKPEQANTLLAQDFDSILNDSSNFNLHCSANYIKDLGGKILIETKYPNEGTSFLLQFPNTNQS